MSTLVRRSVMPVSADALYAWHAQEGAFDRLVPPWEQIEVLQREGGITDGSRLVLQNHLGPVPVRWVADHRDHVEGRQFTDVQTEGPFASWRHVHRFVEGAEAGTSELVDEIEYTLPLAGLGQAVAGASVHRRLERMFAWRHHRTRWDLQRHADFAQLPRKTVAITGASGLLGTSLSAFLRTGGHEVRRLVRRDAKGPDEVHWDVERGVVDRSALEGVDVIIHLAGENVGAGRWTHERKQRIVHSREQGTRIIAEAAASLDSRPVLISASAVGIYGHTADHLVTEEGPHGDDFLARVCKGWELSADPARDAGLRVVHPRIGVVMAAAGGALERLVTPFSLGLGGPVGSGEQYMSWVSIDDTVDALHFLMMRDDMEGPVNLVGPDPVTSAGLARALGGVLGRPAVVPLPAFAVRTVFGEMGEGILLNGQRADNSKLVEAGFTYRFTSLEQTLRSELGLLEV